jgi:hypothetical protein
LIKISKGLAQKDLKKVLKRDKSHIKELENRLTSTKFVLAGNIDGLKKMQCAQCDALNNWDYNSALDKDNFIIKDSANNLFAPPILIESLQHAKALYTTQAANHTYNT